MNEINCANLIPEQHALNLATELLPLAMCFDTMMCINPFD